MANEPTIDAVNNFRVDVNKLLEQQRSLPNIAINIPDDTTASAKPTQLGPSNENVLREALRAQDRMETINLLFSTCRNAADLTPMERRVRLITT